jgi:hypothetical protein
MISEEENDKRLKDVLRVMDEYFEKNKKPSLYDELMHWYQTHDAIQSSHDIVNEILGVVKKWMPKEHHTNSYDFNKCIQMMNEKLK